MKANLFFVTLCLSLMGCETTSTLSDSVAGVGTSSEGQESKEILPDLPPKMEGDRALTPFDPQTDIEAELAAFLTKQAAAWNSGKIEKYMAFYWNSPKLRFASGDTVARGWPQILTRYKKRYPTKEVMGRLTFKAIEVEQISMNTAIVHGQWEIVRTKDAPWGLFTLVIREIDGEWKITSDTTTYGGDRQK